jgi:CPA1 family monovalent cation:H+ antiporter
LRLGAVVAPPDAAAATAVLRQVKPPHRILTILEGESLLNDTTALLIYRLAVGAVAAGSFSIGAVAPTFFLARWSAAWPSVRRWDGCGCG